MDKTWLTAPRSSIAYATGVSSFLDFAAENAGMHKRVLCPCKKCGNRFWLSASMVSEHLVCEGFMHGYNNWIFHGEDVEHHVQTEPANEPEELGEREEMDNMLLDNFGMYDTGSLGMDEDEDSEDENMEDGRDDSGLEADAEEYKRLVEDGSQDLYPSCKTFSKLQFLVRLLNIKNTWKVPNLCYDEILSLVKDVMPEGHTLGQLKNFHACKSYIKQVGIGYESIHACKHDCIMFRGHHANATECPVCKTSRWKSESKGVSGKRMYKVPQKVIRHFKLKPRVRRLFMCSKTAPHMTWHNDGRTKDGMMRHPADSPAWKHFDSTHKIIRDDPRNIRFALATDGFNPFGTMNVAYSIWPIILIPLNLPPWICMKQSNFILSVIVPGRKGPGKEMDVYMQLTIDDLQDFWKPGVYTYDAIRKEKFLLRAALIWTISDWLGRGCLSGESLLACSHCLTNTCTRRLKHGKKTVFQGHRRFLQDNHEFRLDSESFNGEVENREPPIQPSGKEISDMTACLTIDYGKLHKQKRTSKRRKKNAAGEGNQEIYVHTVEETFKKRSVFFQLEYWETLLIRHNLDIMHIQKNAFENIVNTILDVDTRTKDNLNSRMDLEVINIRADLHLDMSGPKPTMRRAIYQMTLEGKKIFCKVIKYAKFPDGYASNLDTNVNLETCKLTGLKSHDCHIIMQDLMPLALCRSLPESVAQPLIRLCKYFKVMYSKVIDVDEIENWENEAFFTLTEGHKEWVMKSASKKFRGFKHYLKRKYWKAELSVKENIENGCEDRVPEDQWESMCKNWRTENAMVLAARNKTTRENQDNCRHTAGTRSYAVVHDQEELRQGRHVSRSELFRIVHTNKKGLPVDSYSSNKIEQITTHFNQNPDLISEDPCDGDLYSRLFTTTRNSRMHGFGLMVGGKRSQQLDEAMLALRDSREETFVLTNVVKSLLVRSQKMEDKIDYLLTSQEHNHTQGEELPNKMDHVEQEAATATTGSKQNQHGKQQQLNSVNRTSQQAAASGHKQVALVSGPNKVATASGQAKAAEPVAQAKAAKSVAQAQDKGAKSVAQAQAKVAKSVAEAKATKSLEEEEAAKSVEEAEKSVEEAKEAAKTVQEVTEVKSVQEEAPVEAPAATQGEAIIIKPKVRRPRKKPEAPCTQGIEDIQSTQLALTQEIEYSQASTEKNKKHKRKKLDELDPEVTITSVTQVKPKCSYKGLLAESTQFIKVKEEKLQESTASRNNRECKTTGSSNVVSNNWLRPRKTLQKIKKGMEVGLTSPNSEHIVAMGTVQELENEDYVKVMVNIVFKKSTMLPRPKGRITHVGQAQAHCIPWPRNNVTDPDIAKTSAEIACTLEQKLNTMEAKRRRVDKTDSQLVGV